MENLSLITIFHLSDKPSELVDLKVTDVTSSSAGLKWRAPSGTDGLPITYYLVERRGKHWGSYVKASTTKGGVTSFDLASILEGLEYHFWVAAANVEG